MTLAVTADDLRVGQGYVRCGRCESVFNALAALHEERDKDEPERAASAAAEPTDPAASAGQAQGVDTPDAPRGDGEPTPDTMEFPLGNVDLAQIFVQPVDLDVGVASGTFESIVLEGDLPGDAPASEFETLARNRRAANDPTPPLEAANESLRDVANAAREATADPASATMQVEALRPPRTAARGPATASGSAEPADTEFDGDATDLNIDITGASGESSRTRLLYAIGCGVAGLALLAQLVHLNRNELAAGPLLHGPLSGLYAALGAPLAPRWDPGAIDVRQLGAFAATDTSGHLVVRASLRNEASRAQPMPLLRLTLQDRYGNRVASRDLSPKEYLGERATDTFLGAGQRIDAEVTVVDPGRDTVGFELDACLPNGAGGVSCGADTRNAR
jgi:predicted Zn finger-like uncharacterized protein